MAIASHVPSHVACDPAWVNQSVESLRQPAPGRAQVRRFACPVMAPGFHAHVTNLRNFDLRLLPERLIVLNVNPQAAGYKEDNAVAITERVLER